MNGADTAWILVASALVLFMTLPGLALFYGGLVRSKNVVSVFMQSYAIACLISVLWFAFGYSIAFGEENPYWGGIGKFFLNGVDLTSLTGTIPEYLFFGFQMTFAIITVVLILGAVVERVKFSFVLAFSGLWMLLVYAPVAHWIWGNGFLSDGGIFGEVGVKDYAGGLVVHMTSGIAALLLAIVIGRRKVAGSPAHSPGMVMIGAAMLWVGWYGFNGGSGLAANANAALSITVTHLAAATSSITWVLLEVWKFKKFTLVGMITGTIAGLAAITPASGFVGPGYAIAIGIVAGVICQEAVYLIRDRLKIDDSLDVFAVHGVGGGFGSMMLAALGLSSWSAQLGSIAIVAAYTTVVSLILIFFCKGLFGLRVDETTEDQGLDMAVHGQPAYHFDP